MERKILIVVGARPNFMKVAPILAAIREYSRTSQKDTVRPILVHTGQHYDAAMSDQFFADLELPRPDVHLGVGSGSHAVQTAEVMKRIEDVLLQEQPDVVVVVGDVNSTVAVAIVTSKISFDKNGKRPLIAHVESGLRSFDRAMPEEVNRVLTDHISDLLFVTEKSGLENLKNEGISSDKIFFVGNTMIDSLLAFQDRAESSDILNKLGLAAPADSKVSDNGIPRYAMLTLHRPSNVDAPDSFREIFEGLRELSRTSPIIFPVHPRTRKRIAEFGLESYLGNGNGHAKSTNLVPSTPAAGIRLVEPLGYLDFMCLMKHSALVITDSGGIQEETTCLGVPCVTVRENTERPVTVERGTNILAGTQSDGIRSAILSQMSRKTRGEAPEKWDGKAAVRILEILIQKVDFARQAQDSVMPTPEQILAK
jgi:UDP-N-acetylglucosamine 2-epimerase (non-hydrolysing)